MPGGRGIARAGHEKEEGAPRRHGTFLGCRRAPDSRVSGASRPWKRLGSSRHEIRREFEDRSDGRTRAGKARRWGLRSQNVFCGSDQRASWDLRVLCSGTQSYAELRRLGAMRGGILLPREMREVERTHGPARTCLHVQDIGAPCAAGASCSGSIWVHVLSSFGGYSGDTWDGGTPPGGRAFRVGGALRRTVCVKSPGQAGHVKFDRCVCRPATPHVRFAQPEADRKWALGDLQTCMYTRWRLPIK